MCKRTAPQFPLTVHHIDRNSGNGINNARVLCNPCHTQTPTYGKEGTSPPDFSEATRKQALKDAENKCQCGGCDECLN